MQDILSMLKGVNPAELNNAISRARAFVKTPEGAQMLEQLKNGKPIEGLPITEAEQNQIIAELTKNPQTAKQLAAILGKK